MRGNEMKRFIVGAALLLGSATTGFAADYTLEPGNRCVPLQPSTQLVSIATNAALTDEVVRMMNEAVDVTEDADWQAYERPAFTWASETKIACGKAYGYLRSEHRDEQYLNKCECFYQRMQYYMSY